MDGRGGGRRHGPRVADDGLLGQGAVRLDGPLHEGLPAVVFIQSGGLFLVGLIGCRVPWHEALPLLLRDGVGGCLLARVGGRRSNLRVRQTHVGGGHRHLVVRVDRCRRWILSQTKQLAQTQQGGGTFRHLRLLRFSNLRKVGQRVGGNLRAAHLAGLIDFKTQNRIIRHSSKRGRGGDGGGSLHLGIAGGNVMKLRGTAVVLRKQQGRRRRIHPPQRKPHFFAKGGFSSGMHPGFFQRKRVVRNDRHGGADHCRAC